MKTKFANDFGVNRDKTEGNLYEVKFQNKK